MMFDKDIRLLYQQWQEQLHQGIAHWQTMGQIQAYALEALLSAWRQGLDEMSAGGAEATRLGVDPAPLWQSWTQAVAQWCEGYARVASTVLAGHGVTAQRQVALLTEHVTELAEIIARMDRRVASLSDQQARLAPDTDHLLQRLQDMQEALERRLHTLTAQLQETEATRTSPPSRSTTRRRPPSA